MELKKKGNGMKQEKENRIGLKTKLEAGKEYYEIRLESIGGLGANLCGKMLGELGVKYLDLNSINFSSYGSEKTGTPVKGFIRYCNKEKEIRVHSPVVNPDLLVVFHQALLQDASVFKGCTVETAVIIAVESGQGNFVKSLSENDGFKEDELCANAGRKQSWHLPNMVHNCGPLYGLEAQRIAMETHSRINVVMLGAVLKVMGMNSLTAGEQIMKDTLGKKYPDALKANLEGMRRGYEEVHILEVGVKDEIGPLHKSQEMSDKNVKTYPESEQENTSNANTDPLEWGYDNAPIGGINPRFGNTVISDLSPSRQGYIPLFIKERCINCGLCFSACPDMVFQFKKGEYKGREMMVNQGLDYYHCKGCLRCVDVCPVNALVRGVEAEHPNKDYFLPNQELIRTPDYYEEAGPDGYITSESYLTERRMEGGEV